tara:strand:- start:931 stop:1194 length:264 start_codon:yes stop_codon:yes gene_type:complete
VNREQRRRFKRMNKAKDNEKLAQKISTFGHRPDNCSACDEPFDKKSKDHAMTWRVVVRENPTRISLFCPQCIEKTQEVLNAHANTTD